jgi:hypothetical protein
LNSESGIPNPPVTLSASSLSDLIEQNLSGDDRRRSAL